MGSPPLRLRERLKRGAWCVPLLFLIRPGLWITHSSPGDSGAKLPAMKWLAVALGAAALTVAGCGEVGLGPQGAASAPAAAAATATQDLRPFAGKTYIEFMAEPAAQRYSLDALGLSEREQARFLHAMAVQRPAPIAAGGGVQALVFAGCAQSGCLEGLSVVAIDTATGEAFVGVSDMAGTEKAVPNDRLEALLRLTSPSQSWDDPVRLSAADAATGP